MLLLGLLLFAASGAFAGLLIADNLGGGPDAGVTVLGHHIATINTLGAFLAGLALALLFCAGIVLMRAGLRWRRRSRPVAPAGTTAPVDTAGADRTARPVADPATDPYAVPPAERPATDQPSTTRPTGGRPRQRFTH